MTIDPPIHEGQVLTGPLFSEPMRVETVAPSGPGAWTAGLVGTQSERFRRVTLTKDQLATLTILSPTSTYDGDAASLKLGLQAYALGIAWEYDPYFGLSVSRVDPLPHQLEAVYDYLLKVARVRFLLADDAGAGKTIMAGLLIRELKLRGLAERILIVTPANLAFQWQRELREKFDEKFLVIRGADLRVQFGVNPWLEHRQLLTSLDLAKREEILPSLRQSHWDLVIVDEAHRMSASAEDRKSLRYKLGELLRDVTDHYLLLTATPHRGDPENFSLFLRLLDQDAFADARSIREAMDRRRAPFYLRRTKEAMLYFPEHQVDGSWAARKIFTRRITRSVEFAIDGDEFELYRNVTRFVKTQSRRAAAEGDDARARAVGFLMALYQRRLASSTFALRRSLENRARRLADNLHRAAELARAAPPDLPTPEELEEMEDQERERFESLIEALTLSRNPSQIEEETRELKALAADAQVVETSGAEAKLSRLRRLLQEERFFDEPEQRLLIFTEFKDTLDYLVQQLRSWGFRVGFIHGGMKPGARDEPGSRLYAEQQFRDGEIQVLVATEAAGEGINLQVCHVLFNYDIPWNPNRLEQRMGRIHRYGQTQDCLIFNFVATNTIEGRVLQKLLGKLQEIRDALDDDAVFNVVGEILPVAHMERTIREFYAGQLGEQDFEERVLRNVNEESFRAICHNALEGLATKKLNLAMLIERRARAQERRMVPETIARFLRETAPRVPMTLREVRGSPHTFDSAAVPHVLKQYERDGDWRLPPLVARYPRFSTDRETAEEDHLEWVTPGHPLFEALRRHALGRAREDFAKGACFYDLGATAPARLDVYRARVVDGLGNVIHERLFVVRLAQGAEPKLHEVGVFGNLQPALAPASLPAVASAPEPRAWLHQEALQPFLDEVQAERAAEVDRIAAHVELSLTELIEREDRLIGRLMEDRERGVEGAAGNLAQAEDRQAALLHRRARRRDELARERSLSLQEVERLASALVLPHPEAGTPEIRRLRSNPETEAVAMRVVMEHEQAEGRAVTDVHDQNLGYDLTSLDTRSGQLRLIEVKGIGSATGTVLLTPNERRVAEDRRDCYWLYVVTHCETSSPLLQDPIKDPARFSWHEVKKVEHYWLGIDALTHPMRVSEPDLPPGPGDEG